MGCCFSREGGGGGRGAEQELGAAPLRGRGGHNQSWANSGVPSGGLSSGPLSSKALAEREKHWRATNIIGLRDRSLRVLPKAALNLGPEARTLDATNNLLQELPREIGALGNLQRLLLGQNLLDALPDTVGELGFLKVLVLDGNRLRTLPEEIGHLTRLERLSAASNALEALPAAIGGLKKLTQLDVSSNALQSLPAGIGGCASLEELLANNNQLESLPSQVVNLARLKTLILDNNKVRQLPADLLIGCSALQSMSLHGNPFTMGQLEQMQDYEAYEMRRRGKVDKQLAGHVLMGSRALDDGVDRQVAPQ